MAGAAGILIDKLAIDEAILRLRNRRRVQNHIGGIHAAATALLAESATGAVFAMNVRQSQPFFRAHDAPSEHSPAPVSLPHHFSLILFGHTVQVRDDALPLLKSMRVDYLRVARGDLRAVAALRPEQAELVSAAATQSKSRMR